ncbi:alpha/beta fold hydrolase [Sphingomonas sp. LY160]|uniref:alpha/beta fold hydrolase n=1 Tax=Sphingomonas sp. LY160 TaxID=3095342 RepID=UPI002ADECD2A|nr:alpha/beta fold hydrolase [Sphingomonas sp. LY160]MEA1071251.1 alpha/beta fold hydrolase [Sphingomonas sp. LY160]
MIDVPIHHWTASDGVRLAWREVGSGRPVILLHGLFSDAVTNWIKFGAAEAIAARGRRVIMPDLRAHGASDKPQEVDAYPRGVLARDARELIAHLSIDDYDLGGFSLGARTTVQVVGEGAKPASAVLAGMGIEGLQDWNRRQAFFHEAIAQFDIATRGDRWWMAIQFMKTMQVDRVAAGHLLRTFEDANPAWLDAFTMTTMVLCGSEDDDNGSAPELAERLPNADYVAIPGTHMSSVTKPDFGAELARFLAAP